MTILLVLLLIVLALAAYIFFAPFYFEIDNTRGLFRFRFHRLIFLDLRIGDELALELSAFGWKKNLELHPGKKDPPNEKERSVSDGWKKRMPPLKKLLRVFRSFEFTKCYVRLDLGDMRLNGMMYPVFAWLRWYSHKDIEVSFTGTNIIIVEIRNSLARMSRA